MLKQLIIRNRSYRRFHEEVRIEKDDLLDMIDNARLSASGRNMQPLKYMLFNSADKNELIFQSLSWAGYLTDWPGPVPGERPSAYIIVLHDKSIAPSYFCDDGIATQNILLTAVEKGFGGCIIASVKREQLSKAIKIPDGFDIIHVIALGKPLETVVIETIKDNDIRYWRDENSVHHVPKRSLEEVIFSV